MGFKELLGLDACDGMPMDAKVLFGNKVCRALAFGLSSVVLAQYLSLIGLADHSIGLLMTCTLLGDAAVSLLVTLTADRLGRRVMLLLGAGLKLLGALIFAAASKDLWLLLLFGATVGVISPSGNEVGPFQTLEQSILSEQVEPHKRTKLFNVYNLVGYLATAFGQVAAGIIVDQLANKAEIERVDGFRIIFLAYAALASILALLSFLLSASCEGSTWRGATQGPFTYQPLASKEEDDVEQEAANQGSKAPASEVDMQGPTGALEKSALTQSLQSAKQATGVHAVGPDAAGSISPKLDQRDQLSQQPRLSHSPTQLLSQAEAAPCQDPQYLPSTSSSSVESKAGANMISLHRARALAASKTHQLALGHSSSTTGSSTPGSAPPLVSPICHTSFQYGISNSKATRHPFHSPPTADSASHIVNLCCDSSSSGSMRPATYSLSHPQSPVPDQVISGKSLRLILGLSLLLMVDSMGAGMIPGAFIVHYLHATFNFSQSLLGSLLSVSSTVAGFAGLLAGWMSDRMGLVRTMVLTHLPSSFMLLLVPFTPPAVAMTLIVVRSCLGRMDVGPRQSYISGIVPAHERTAALGITNIIRSLGAAMGPFVTGHMATRGLWPEVFFLSGGLMILYNIALLVFFNTVKADYELIIIPQPPIQYQGEQQQQPLKKEANAQRDPQNEP